MRNNEQYNGSTDKRVQNIHVLEKYIYNTVRKGNRQLIFKKRNVVWAIINNFNNNLLQKANHQELCLQGSESNKYWHISAEE